MAKRLEDSQWWHDLAGLAMGTFLILITESSVAQLVPDETLGEESSVVNVRDETSDSINGGATRGSNLFHSFQEFNVGEGRGVYFSNPDEINNIFSRVTGSNPSNILGRLGVDGAANLYLINPNGIIFGENSSLDVQGSFTATTAHGVRFGEQGTFDAINPQAPQLLTVNPSAYFFNHLEDKGINGIQSQRFLAVSEGKNLTLLGGDIELSGTTVVAEDGSTELRRSILFAPGGLIELGSFNDSGEVVINESGNLIFPDLLSRGNISLSNTWLIVNSNGGGFININAQNLELSESSLIAAGIGKGLGNPDTIAGDITINLIEKFSLDNSIVSNGIGEAARGTAGDIQIFANSVELNNLGIITSSISNLGQGNAGDIIINLTEKLSLDNQAAIFKNIGEEAQGTAGDIQVFANFVELNNNAKIFSSIFDLGQGDAGNIKIVAAESITVNGESTLIDITLAPEAEGNTGDIELTTDSLTLTNGGTISLGTLGQGNLGSIIINATDSIIIDGGNSQGLVSSIYQLIGNGNAGDIEINTHNLNLTNGGYIGSQKTDNGNASEIKINATGSIILDGEILFIDEESNLQLIFGSGIFNSQGVGEGNTSNITITTGSLAVTNGAEISSSTNNNGDAGDITINATDSIVIDGEKSNGLVSRISSNTSRGEGNGGDIKLTTNSLQILNGGTITASTFGKGNAGDITIKASDSIFVDGDGSLKFFIDDLNPDILDEFPELKGRTNVEEIQTFNSNISSRVPFNAEGDGGDIELTTNSLKILNGGAILTDVVGRGKGSNITIDATDSIVIDGESSVQSSSQILSDLSSIAEGKAGNIDLNTDFLSVTNGAIISANTRGNGNGGDIRINANSLQLENNVSVTNLSESDFTPGDIILKINNSLSIINSIISSQAEQSIGGNLTITAETIELRGDSLIRTDVGAGSGNGGDIFLQADSIVAFDDSDIFANAADGQGGNITLDTPAFFAENFTLNSLTSNPDNLGDNARVDINATGAVSGIVSLPDISFIQNSLTELPNNALNTDQLVANSCVVPNRQQKGTFIITGNGGLATTPEDESVTPYSTGEVQTIESDNSTNWQPGDPIIEPQGAYRLSNGKLVLSRKCSRS